MVCTSLLLLVQCCLRDAARAVLFAAASAGAALFAVGALFAAGAVLIVLGAAASMARLLVQYCLPLLLLVQHCLLQELSASFAFACVCSCGIRSPSAAVSVVALHCCWRLSPLSARAAAVQRQLGRIAFACE